MAVVMVGALALDVSPASGGRAVPFPLPVQITTLPVEKAMDVSRASHAPGAPVVQWAANGGRHQLWKVMEFGTGTNLFLIQSQESGQVLDVDGGSTASGRGLVQNPWAATLSQLWLALPFGDGGRFFVIVNLKSAKVADVRGASPNNGAPIIQWSWHGGLNQVFALDPRT